LDAAHIGLDAQQLRGLRGGGLQRLERGHAGFNIQLGFRDRRRRAPVGLEWKLVGAERNVDTQLDCILQHGPMVLAGAINTLQEPVGRADLAIELARPGLTDHDGRHEPHTLGLHLLQHTGIEVIAMLEAIDAELHSLMCGHR